NESEVGAEVAQIERSDGVGNGASFKRAIEEYAVAIIGNQTAEVDEIASVEIDDGQIAAACRWLEIERDAGSERDRRQWRSDRCEIHHSIDWRNAGEVELLISIERQVGIGDAEGGCSQIDRLSVGRRPVAGIGAVISDRQILAGCACDVDISDS